MSEPLSSVEIEDVLSSIRRLVSDDLRPQSGAQPSGRQQAAAPAPSAPAPSALVGADAGADKLVLTPALRIVPEAPALYEGDAAVEVADFIDVEEDEPATASVLAFLPTDPAAADADGLDTPAPTEGAAASQDWADAAEAAVRAELEEAAAAAASARFLDEPPEDPAFDEDTMRDLVRDIIREELQGTLGERITRNVRKLVRVEIARAMAVRDFD